jgi:hypothetical protein
MEKPIRLMTSITKTACVTRFTINANIYFSLFKSGKTCEVLKNLAGLKKSYH